MYVYYSRIISAIKTSRLAAGWLSSVALATASLSASLRSGVHAGPAAASLRPEVESGSRLCSCALWSLVRVLLTAERLRRMQASGQVSMPSLCIV